MYFITNRMPNEGVHSKPLGRKVTFDLQNTTVTQSAFFCTRQGVNDYTEIGYKAFMGHLKALDDEYQIVLYIHGFNNTGEKEIFPNAQRLQEHLDIRCKKCKTLVIPLIWPCDDDSIVSILDDYWDDQNAADMSGMAFARVFGFFDTWRQDKPQLDIPCLKRINVVAHSMGNRVLQNALNIWVNDFNNPYMPQIFRNIFMIAADVRNETLERGKLGQYICDAARNVVVYYANDDFAMPASKIANVRRLTLSRRLGMTGPESLKKVPKNVYEVDCDDFNNKMDGPKGHSYFLDDDRKGRAVDHVKVNTSPVLIHLAKAIDTARVEPDNRHHRLTL